MVFVESGRRIESLAFNGLTVIGSEFDRNMQRMALVQGRDAQPVVEDLVFGFLDHHNVRIGLDERNAKLSHLPFAPFGFLAIGIGLLLLGLFPIAARSPLGIVS